MVVSQVHNFQARFPCRAYLTMRLCSAFDTRFASTVVSLPNLMAYLAWRVPHLGGCDRDEEEAFRALLVGAIPPAVDG